MRIVLLCLVLAGCAAPEPPAAPPRDCPTLPTLKPGAGRPEMLAHIRTTAELYAQCAGGTP